MYYTVKVVLHCILIKLSINDICNSSLQFTIPTWCKWAEYLILPVTTKEMLLPWIKHSEQMLETLCGISLTEYHPSSQQHREPLGLHGLPPLTSKFFTRYCRTDCSIFMISTNARNIIYSSIMVAVY